MATLLLGIAGFGYTRFAAAEREMFYGRGDDFYMYDLQVYCNPNFASKIFSARGKGAMGTKVLCAGKCPGGRVVKIKDVLAGLPGEVAAAFTTQLAQHEADAAAGKTRSLKHCDCDTDCPKCDKGLYEDYLRKRQAAMDLFKHASELRLTASKLLAEHLVYEEAQARWEAETEMLGDTLDLTWREYASRIKRKMAASQGAMKGSLVRRGGQWVVSKVPIVVRTVGVAGWINTIAQTAYRGNAYADEYARYQKEAQEATKKAEEMWRKALEDFTNYLKGQEACTDESKAAAIDEAQLDRAKAAIDEWTNNQNLYWDPIKNEAVTYREAIKRANEYLQTGKLGSLTVQREFFVFASYAADDKLTKGEALKAAIAEMDKALASFDRLDGSISKYFQAQKTIEQKLEAAFGVKGVTTGPPKASGFSGADP